MTVEAQDGPFVVAHRAGNDLRTLRRALALGCPLIEADVHLFRGRLEVRHRKTLGPVPILWDQWELAPPDHAPLELEHLLAATDEDGRLMLDLKGRDPRLAIRVARAVARAGANERVTACSRNWSHLESLARATDVRLIHSAGSRRQLQALITGDPGTRLAGVSVNRRLLDRQAVAQLRRRTSTVMAWPVEDAATASELLDSGVHGLISRRFEALTAAMALSTHAAVTVP